MADVLGQRPEVARLDRAEQEDGDPDDDEDREVDAGQVALGVGGQEVDHHRTGVDEELRGQRADDQQGQRTGQPARRVGAAVVGPQPPAGQGDGECHPR